ncbi:unnamed protein product [Candidula unifasciata]|uniref:Serpin domain-containing protein n=1 Tax=Candidula unifasciata TaxID=100452 RepID=A0A8S3ZZR9_9EUPU|nr:unnamed protein product [Candidula unifasciata]
MKAPLCILCLLVATDGSANWDKKVAQVCNSFSQSLYQNIAVNGCENSIYSPLSIHQALSMVTLGARGDTAAELSRVLGLSQIPSRPNQPQASYLEVIQQLRQVPHVEILTVNAIFVNPSTEIKADFTNNVTKFYQAEVSSFDLISPGGPERHINRFVYSKTKGLIKTVLTPGRE